MLIAWVSANWFHRTLPNLSIWLLNGKMRRRGRAGQVDGREVDPTKRSGASSSCIVSRRLEAAESHLWSVIADLTERWPTRCQEWPMAIRSSCIQTQMRSTLNGGLESYRVLEIKRFRYNWWGQLGEGALSLSLTSGSSKIDINIKKRN